MRVGKICASEGKHVFRQVESSSYLKIQDPGEKQSKAVKLQTRPGILQHCGKLHVCAVIYSTYLITKFSLLHARGRHTHTERHTQTQLGHLWRNYTQTYIHFQSNYLNPKLTLTLTADPCCCFPIGDTAFVPSCTSHTN